MEHALFNLTSSDIYSISPETELPREREERKRREFEEKIRKEEAERIRKSELYRSALMRGMNEGREDSYLLEIALECIAAMANDKPLMARAKLRLEGKQ